MTPYKFKVGKAVEIKPSASGYELWYKNKVGTIIDIKLNDNGELRYIVDIGGERLPFGEWELIDA